MHDIAHLEATYRNYIENLSSYIPEGIVPVDIAVLQHLDLLNFSEESDSNPETLTRYFHVIESAEKITLFNDQFAVWIVPDHHQNQAITYTLVSLKNEEELSLELAFSTAGIYNTSRLVLRILERFLSEIQENESALADLRRIC